MLPTRAGKYRVRGRPTSAFFDREFDVIVTEIKQNVRHAKLIYDFTPAFYGSFTRDDFYVVGGSA